MNRPPTTTTRAPLTTIANPSPHKTTLKLYLYSTSILFTLLTYSITCCIIRMHGAPPCTQPTGPAPREKHRAGFSFLLSPSYHRNHEQASDKPPLATASPAPPAPPLTLGAAAAQNRLTTQLNRPPAGVAPLCSAPPAGGLSAAAQRRRPKPKAASYLLAQLSSHPSRPSARIGFRAAPQPNFFSWPN